MKTITLETCTKGLARIGWAKIWITVALTAIFGISFLFRSEITKTDIADAVLVFIGVAALCLWQRSKNKKITAENIYLVDDVFLSKEITHGWRRYRGRVERCAVTFARQGIYEVTLAEAEQKPENPSCDYSAVHFSNPGDEFYLLMLRAGKENRILKCFNKRYYALSEEDFVRMDGEYRPKMAKG